MTLKRRNRRGLSERTFDENSFGWQTANIEELTRMIEKSKAWVKWHEDEQRLADMRLRLHRLQFPEVTSRWPSNEDFFL